MIFLSLGDKAIRGSRINKALDEIVRKGLIGDNTFNGFTEDIKSFEFVPRVCDWSYRNEYNFFFPEKIGERMLRIVTVNPKLYYREIGITPYNTTRYSPDTAKEIVFEKDSELIVFIGSLCSSLIFELLRELGVIK